MFCALEESWQIGVLYIESILEFFMDPESSGCLDIAV